jgi:3-deoxy-D-manno-octulosonic-acid transferase
MVLKARSRRGKEDPVRLGERLGRAGKPRPDGKLMWLHGASVGEGLSLLPLVGRLNELAPDTNLLVTSGTRTSAEILGRRLPPSVLHQFVPIDTPAATQRFVAHWRPDLAVFVESELWPNLITAAKRSGARMALISARMSESSFRNWRRAPKAALSILGAFDLILAKDETARSRFSALHGAVGGLWDAKLGAPPLLVDQTARALMSSALAGRTLLVAASTHPGEEAVVLDAFRKASSDRESVLLVIAPRHPARGAEVEAMAKTAGFSTARRSGDGDPAAAKVYVADTLGELGLFFSLAKLAFIGGSFDPFVGGHNPLEPARLGCPIVVGPHTSEWPVYEAFRREDAVRLAANSNELATQFNQALSEDLDDLAERGVRLAAHLDAENAQIAPRLLTLIAS